jgi:predicted ATPase/DNA-binding SARP family transcriptional activator
VRFGVLGPLSVWTSDGEAVRVPEAKVRALLADLLIHEGRPVPADRLADDLWGDDPPGNPANTLQTKISQLRRVLGRERVTYQPAGYALRADDVDALAFAALLDRARRTDDPRERVGLLTDALALWRGPAYADVRDEEFARAAAVHLDELRLTALEEQAEARLALGEHAALADELAEPVAAHPLRERLRAVHLKALYRAGRQHEALEGYAALRERLSAELGADPSPELAELNLSMLRQEPALAAPRRGNLPAALTELLGREQAVSAVAGLLGRSRLVTLTGPGGVGKTRLALAVADLPGPQETWLVELAGTRGGLVQVAETVAATLGIRDETAPGPPARRPQEHPAETASAQPARRPGENSADTAQPPPRRAGERLPEKLADALRGRELLLVLDNCEHLVEAVADLVHLLLRTAPGLRVLATSQESLAIPGEALYPVEPLDPGSAVRLFAARAGIDPGIDRPSIEAICTRLDGLPLALELAAARVRALGVRGVAERLDDRFRLLGRQVRGLPARQRTLGAVIDWSWEQLTQAQRRALCALAVHPGGCTIEAAGVAEELVDQLVNRSMAVADPPRYRLLESIAAYCLARLDPDDPLFARRDAYYTALAETAEPHLRGAGQREWLARLDEEAHNLRTVHSPALLWYLYLRGRHGEAHRLSAGTAWEPAFAMLVGLPGRAPAAVGEPPDARCRWFVGHAYLHLGDSERAAPYVEQALRQAREQGERWVEAAALTSLAKLAIFRGDLDTGRSSAEESLALFTALADQWGRLQAADMLGHWAEITGDHARARELHTEGLRIAEDLRLWTDVSYRLSSLGRIALLTGDLDGSRALHERGLRVAGEQSNRFAEEFARVGLGLTARRAGDLDAAERHLMESLDWNRRLEKYYGVTLILAELGFVAELRGDAVRAGRLHAEGLAAARELGDPRAVALALEGLAGAAALDGRPEDARRLLGEAERLRASVGAPLPEEERGDVDRIEARLKDG